MFGIFKSKDRRRGADLARLATRTIAMMDKMIADRSCSADDRQLIQSHRERRRDQVALYTKFADGRNDDLDDLMSPIRHYDVFRRSMENELNNFSTSAAQLASYIRLIREP